MAIKQPLRRAAPHSAPPRRQGYLWSRVHFLIRFLGLTGSLLGIVGFLVASTAGVAGNAKEILLQAIQQALAWHEAPLWVWLVAGGTAAVMLALVVEALGILLYAAGRRSAFGFNALLQVALASALVVGINVWSFRHYLRFDCTRDQQFTLPEKVRKELETLDPNVTTTVVVYQPDKTSGTRAAKPDRYDYAAERKVVEKIKDLVDQLRELGKQFDVKMLDVEDEKYDEQLQSLTRDAPELRQAIDRAQENSIFIHAGGRVQQMSFNELFLLDRVASQNANHRRGNLVLLPQGGQKTRSAAEPFADKIIHLEERKPRIGVLVMHELLTTQGSEGAFTLRGLRRTLETHGFEVQDVVLRRLGDAGPEPAADTSEETKLERLEAEIEDLELDMKDINQEIKILKEEIGIFELKPGEKEADKLEELSNIFVRQLRGTKLTRAQWQEELRVRHRALVQRQELLKDNEKERDRVRAERDKLNIDELREAQRMKDVKAKLDRALAECDLLFIPRLTRRQNLFMAAPYSFHKLSEAQLASIKEFVEAGKPIFACLGPANEPRDPTLGPPTEPPPDSFDRMLADLGVRLGKQTILFNADSKAFTDRRPNPFRTDEGAKVPPLDFESPASAWRGKWATLQPDLQTNKIREGMRILLHSIGRPAEGETSTGQGGGTKPTPEGQGFAMAIRFPRPVYYEPPAGTTPAQDPVFLVTPEGWNDDAPFPVRGHRPHYKPPEKNDPDNGTLDEKRRGEFPVGVAFEAPIPSSWSSATAKAVRIAVIGQGDVFVGEDLSASKDRSPAKERLLLQTVNWLLGRDNFLPQDNDPWSYPRVDLLPGSQDEQLWLWGARLGLPVLFAYLGLVVLLLRSLR
jgi:hypothetical protein